MKKLGLLTLALLFPIALATDASAQRGGRGDGGGSRGSSASQGGRSSGSSGGASRSSGGSSRSSGGVSRSSGGSSGRSSGVSSSSGSRSSGVSSGSSSRSASRPTSGTRTYGSSRSAPTRVYEPRGPVDRDAGGRAAEAPVERGPALDRADYEARGETSVPRSAPVTGDLDRGDLLDLRGSRSIRRGFPAQYEGRRSAGRPAVPARSIGARSATSSDDLVRLVDRYRRARLSGDAAGASRTPNTVAPILDRFGRNGRGTSRGQAVSGRAASSPSLGAERYARGPLERRTPSGASAARGDATRRTIGAARTERDARPTSSASTPSRRGGAKSAGATRASGPSAVRSAQGLARLAAADPAAARRITQAGDALGRATSLGLAAGVGAAAGPAAAGAVLLGTRAPKKKPIDSSFYFGYGYYPWWGGGFGSSHWWFGFSWSSCHWSPSWCWSPFWTCSWYPFYFYSYKCFYPFYYKPYYYYPFAYSTVVHHYYDDYDDDVVVIYADDDDVVYADEPVGEGAVAEQERPADSSLRVSLDLAAERYLTLGDRAFREGRFADAAQFYAKAVEFAPEEAVLHLVLSDALFATADYHYAAYSLRRALELDPSLAQAVVDKHDFYQDPADFDRHVARAEEFLERNPADADARLVLAANYLFGGRPASAVDLLEPLVAAAPRGDDAAALLLESARSLQFGPPVPAGGG